MEKHLKQNEIDALFTSIGQTEVRETDADQAKPWTDTERFNFSRAGQISNEQMKAITLVNDLFARNLTHNLGAWLRSKFQVTLVSGEQMMYAEFLERVPELTYVCSTRLDPLDALGVIQMDLAMAPPIVDLLLGGVGRAGPLREPTDIENEILLSVMQIVERGLNAAWQPVGLKFAIEQPEKATQISRLMPMTEKTLCMSFEVRMSDALGMLNLCLPAAVLNTLLRRLIAERERPRRRSVEARARMVQLMSEAKFGAALEFPPMRLKARELAQLVPGKVLSLPLPRHAMAELHIGGMPVFKAQPVRSGELRGAQLKGYSAEVERQGIQ